MAIPQSATILDHLRQTVLRQDRAGPSDGQLLRSYLYREDQSAFAALVRRHGPMVRGVCRRMLRDAHDADDAFQAAFLVLIRRASALATREVIGDWLHGVAYRTALKARSAAARRRLKERLALRREAILDTNDHAEWLPLLDQEIGRLPSKYRLPILLCDLEGRTRKEAAEQLGWREGTLSGRLSRARALLARRLTRRGVTLSVATLSAVAGEASAQVPSSLVASTCKSATEFASPSAAAVSAHVAALTEGVVKAMFVVKMKKIGAIVLGALLLMIGVGAWRYAVVAAPNEKPTKGRTASIAPKTDEMPIPKVAPPRPIPATQASTSGYYQIELKIVEKVNGENKLRFDPSMRVVEGQAASFAYGELRTIQLGSGRTEQVAGGPSARVVVRSVANGKVRLDITVTQPTSQAPNDDVVLVTRTVRFLPEFTLGEQSELQYAVRGDQPSVWAVTAIVHEAKFDTGEKTISEAERVLKMAEFWRRNGYLVSAYFYYEQLEQTFAKTVYAERAKERMTEIEKQIVNRKDPSEADRFFMKRRIESKMQTEQPEKIQARSVEKSPARVGQVFIRGNKRLTDESILKTIPLYPGQILTFPDLQIAERNLARLTGVKNAQVRVIDREGQGEFKDIEITLVEK